MPQVKSNPKIRTILVAEDDQNDVFLLERAFVKAGGNASLKFVRDGEEAVAYIRGDGGYSDRENFPFPSLLMLDLNMPKKNGFEVLEELHTDLSLKKLVAIVFTSSAKASDIKLALGLGANSYVFKPFNQNALVAIAKQISSSCLSLEQSNGETEPQLLSCNT